MLTWLYVPGDRPDRFAKAVASGADTVILDLEDAVHPERKAYARDAVAEFCADRHSVPIEVRINPIDGAGAVGDLAAIDGASIDGIRLPKVDGRQTVLAAVARVPANVPVHCLIESAMGVEQAFDIATAHRCVGSIGLGEADLTSDLGVPDETGLAYARGRIVVAARAAGLPSPAMSVYADVRDMTGLAESCRIGRRLGFFGRAAIHPAQLPAIVDAFRPTPAEVERATELLSSMSGALADGRSVAVLSDGRFADPAMVRSAQRIVEIARRYGAKA